MADIRERVELRSGVLRVGASTTVAGYWLPPHVATFVQRFPGVGFELQVGNTAGIGHAIAEGRIDVDFVEGVVDDPGIVATPWREIGRAHVCTPVTNANLVCSLRLE